MRTIFLLQHPSTIMPQPPTVMPQPPTVMPQPPTIMLQPSTVVPSPPQSSLPGNSQPFSLAPVTDPDHIKPETLDAYQKLLLEAQQYENRYKTIDLPRKKQLASCIKVYMNKLRKDTFNTLTNEFFEFLNGQEQKISNQSIRVSNEEGKNLFSKKQNKRNYL